MNIQYLEMWQTNIEIIQTNQDVDNVFRLDRDTCTMYIYYDDASFLFNFYCTF
jgi:Holliday junction resolvase RusA-like endonuclease